jgi:hypothetical protein
VIKTLHPSVAELHKQWVKLENEQHQLATAIDSGKVDALDREAARQRQAKLLLEITSLVAAIRDAPATTIEDFIALLDVALHYLMLRSNTNSILPQISLHTDRATIL